MNTLARLCIQADKLTHRPHLRMVGGAWSCFFVYHVMGVGPTSHAVQGHATKEEAYCVARTVWREREAAAIAAVAYRRSHFPTIA